MKKILIVDDERDIVETLSFMLKAKGFECICAYDGEEGLNLAKNSSSSTHRTSLDSVPPLLSAFRTPGFLR